MFVRKKFIAILLAAAMCLCFCACGSSKGSTEETVEITTVAEEQQDREEESISVYHKIYDEYAEKMEKAGDTKALDKIFEESKGKMKDAMLSSTEDDQQVYEKWFAKLSENYSELLRKLQ